MLPLWRAANTFHYYEAYNGYKTHWVNLANWGCFCKLVTIGHLSMLSKCHLCSTNLHIPLPTHFNPLCQHTHRQKNKQKKTIFGCPSGRHLPFRHSEVKIEKSEKAGSRRESNPGHLAWAASALILSYNDQTTTNLHTNESLFVNWFFTSQAVHHPHTV